MAKKNNADVLWQEQRKYQAIIGCVLKSAEKKSRSIIICINYLVSKYYTTLHLLF